MTRSRPLNLSEPRQAHFQMRQCFLPGLHSHSAADVQLGAEQQSPLQGNSLASLQGSCEPQVTNDTSQLPGRGSNVPRAGAQRPGAKPWQSLLPLSCLLYTSDAADEERLV